MGQNCGLFPLMLFSLFIELLANLYENFRHEFVSPIFGFACEQGRRKDKRDVEQSRPAVNRDCSKSMSSNLYGGLLALCFFIVSCVKLKMH